MQRLRRSCDLPEILSIGDKNYGVLAVKQQTLSCVGGKPNVDNDKNSENRDGNTT
jgi:hypothetical protein